MKLITVVTAVFFLVAATLLPQTGIADDKVKLTRSVEKLKDIPKDGTIIKQGDHKLKKLNREKLQSQSGKPAPKPKPTPKPKPDPEPPCNDGSGTDPDCDDDEDEDRDVDTDKLRSPAQTIQG